MQLSTLSRTAAFYGLNLIQASDTGSMKDETVAFMHGQDFNLEFDQPPRRLEDKSQQYRDILMDMYGVFLILFIPLLERQERV
ncbi:hypothetical protein VTO73DRAFT_15175 [Trametes versicolor]